MNEQKKLPRPCKGLTFKVKIDNIAIFLRTGDYEDGTLGEIFIDMYKEGAGYKSILANFSITVSWLLQYGVPLERLVEKFKFTRFEPRGIVTGDNDIKMCSSIIDFVFRRLAITYLDMNELGHAEKTYQIEGKVPDKEWVQEIVHEKNKPVEAQDIKFPEFGSAVEEYEDDRKKHDYTKGPFPPDIDFDKTLETVPPFPKEIGNLPGMAVYTFGSGSMGIRPYGYKHEEFLKYCRKNKDRDSTTEGEFVLDFNHDSIVIFDPPSNIEKVTKSIKLLWFKFYGEKLDLGDI